MKLSESRLRKIIFEESRRMLAESTLPMEDDEPLRDQLERPKFIDLSGEVDVSKIERAIDEIESGSDVVIELNPLSATIMAAYGMKNAGNASRFRLTPASSGKLSQFVAALEKLVSAPSADRRTTNEQVSIGWGILGGVVSVFLANIIANYVKGENANRRQARQQAEMLKLAQQAVEKGCEVEVETNSSATANAETSVKGSEKASASKASSSAGGTSTSGSKNDAEGRIIIKNCKPKKV